MQVLLRPEGSLYCRYAACMLRRTLLTLSAALCLAVPAAATPVSDAKATLGGVIENARSVPIVGTTYLLVTHRPYAGGRLSVTVLKPFAGTYTTMWSSPRDYGEGYGDALLGTDLTDLNRDGVPEVYLADVTAGNANGVETYTLVDLATKASYTVEVSFMTDGTPGAISIGKSLSETKAAPFRVYMEAKVARSEALKDSRNAFAKAGDAWYEKYGAFLNHGTFTPMRVTPITAKYGSELCTLEPGSVLRKATLNGLEYRSVFKFGLVSFNAATKTCAVILATPGDSPDQLEFLRGELHIPLVYSGKTAIWNPDRHTLRWK